MTFAPALLHDDITKVTEGVYAVRGSFQMGPGLRISRTMTIVEAGDGLVLLNAMRLSERGEAQLERLGPVKHLVKLSDSHGIDEPYVFDRYRPEVWAIEGARLRTGVPRTRVLGPDGPIAGASVIGFAGTSGWAEVAYLVPGSGGTLVTCDAIQHHVDLEHTTLLARIMTPLLGFKGGLIVASMWRKLQKVQGDAVRSAFAELAAHSYANLVTGHGPAMVGQADTCVRRAVETASQG
jgi:hypothetical protein